MTMTSFEAITHIANDPNDKVHTCNEWTEANLWALTRMIVSHPNVIWTTDQLDKLLDRCND